MVRPAEIIPRCKVKVSYCSDKRVFGEEGGRLQMQEGLGTRCRI